MASPLRRAVKVLAWVPVAIFFNDHVLTLATITGRSMQPTFNPDSSLMWRDIVILNRYAGVISAAGQGGFKIGDVVALRSPTDPGTVLIKRLLALPNAVVQTSPPADPKTVRVPKGHVWVEGDERYHSRDSNTFGAVPMGLLEARVEWIVWPLSRFGRVQRREEPNSRVFQPRTDFVP